MLTRLIILASLILQFFLPWWIVAPIAFLLALWRAHSASHAFKSGFKAIFFLWMAMSLIKSLPNENILANRIGQMLMLPDWSFNWLIVIFVSSAIGGLAAGLSAFSGYFWQSVIGRNTGKRDKNQTGPLS